MESDTFPEAAEAETEVELEHCWYGQLDDVSQLDTAASSEYQEQWNVKSKVEDSKYGGSIRVRKSVRYTTGDRSLGVKSYMLCIKAFEHDKIGVLENEFEINEETFEQFRRIAESGMRKTRYTFPIEGTDYAFEVDVSEGDSGWVKVDLEVDDPKYLIPEFPIRLKGLVKDNPLRRTPEVEKLVKHVMDTYFIIPNAYSQ